MMSTLDGYFEGRNQDLGWHNVDELRIMVNPVALGEGTPLFGTAKARIDLKLLKTRPFDSGNVLHFYRPATA
ncbi:hypothetical protein [Streptosporangium sp. NPDC001681]|uniref:hypothetical protein n=1 Tax=Streptosporangium sp. NPDC001681 TaxID=3154395 RepID=UPI00331C2AB6